MKLIIAGGRNYHITDADWQKLDALPITEIVSGGASGADAGGEAYAQVRGFPVTRFVADWSRYGYKAGPIRNQHMAEYADAVALFPGGRGTNSMAAKAKKAGIVIYDFRDSSTELGNMPPPHSCAEAQAVYTVHC
jgi:hypothetical protein